MKLNGPNYETILGMLLVKCNEKNVPFTDTNYETMELTCEARAQGIRTRKEITAFVKAGQAEKRFEDRSYLIKPDELLDNSDDIINGSE